jgi:surfeit locus 1 family protein
MLRFAPQLRSWPTLAAVAGILLTLALGNWQLGRAHTKIALAERIQAGNRDALVALPAEPIKAEDVAWRHVTVNGRFEPKYTVLIDNRVSHHVAGYHVVTPLRIGTSELFVLVNRGWVAGTGSRAKLPSIATPAGAVEITGLATVPPQRIFELSSRVTEGQVWQNLTLERYREAVPIALQPIVLRQENDVGDGLRREWDAPDLGVDRHYAYAFQWFALAATILAAYFFTHVKRT